MTSVNFGVRFSKISNSVLSSTFRVFLSWSIFLQLSKHLLAQGVDKKGSGALTIMFKDYILFFLFGNKSNSKDIFHLSTFTFQMTLETYPFSENKCGGTKCFCVWVCVCVCVCARVWRRMEEVFMDFFTQMLAPARSYESPEGKIGVNKKAG